jgi:pimeloyl-ACP methyl ester carboxylesterase
MPGWSCAGVLACVLAGAHPREAVSLVALGGNDSTGVVRSHSGPFDPGRPTLVVIHGINPTPRLVHFTLAERYAEAARGTWNVLAWDWNAATLPSLRPPVVDRAAVGQGACLAASLASLGVDPARLHLVGHSTGSVVAASCARTLSAWHGRQVGRLTLLDPVGSQHPLIFGELAASRSAAVLENFFADSPSGFGRFAPYEGVRNYSTPTPSRWWGFVNPSRTDHLNVVRWHLRQFPQ